MSTLEMVLWASLIIAMGFLMIGTCCCLIRPPHCIESEAALKEADGAEYVAEAARG